MCQWVTGQAYPSWPLVSMWAVTWEGNSNQHLLHTILLPLLLTLLWVHIRVCLFKSGLSGLPVKCCRAQAATAMRETGWKCKCSSTGIYRPLVETAALAICASFATSVHLQSGAHLWDMITFPLFSKGKSVVAQVPQTPASVLGPQGLVGSWCAEVLV
jgi:hypothetical protein